jgi:hypothetical protein
MRRPVKPFSVEVRRAGRRVPQSFIPTREPEEAPQPDYFAPVPEAAREPRRPPEPTPPRRVLQDLNEPAFDPLAERLQQLESRLARRGRPPGSKNKVARPRPTTDLREFFDAAPQTAAAPVAFTAIPFKRRPREQRFAWIKKKLHRGERWKRRLPKILW